MFTICPVILKKQLLRRCLMTTTAPGLFILVSFLIYFNVMLIGIELELKYKFLAAMFLMTIQIKFLEYGIYVQLIYEYLSMLLESLRCLKENVNRSAERKQSMDWSFCKYFKQNQACLQETWLLVYRLEQYFAWPILLLFLYNGIIILCTVSWAYVRYIYETEFVYQIIRLAYISLVLLNMLLLCYLTQKCINQYKKFSNILLNLKLYPHDKQMIMIVKEYSQQLMHQPILFSCNGYININHMFYGKALLLILTYVIILVQFKLTDWFITETSVLIVRPTLIIAKRRLN
ncbi:putative gustatory receptor 98c [Lucilia cuprina]|uniref:Putative gustatory receptor 98c n=1 Tax=Lucilia cuprina TaxID=7375 RepID=A0A0L0BW62_LUCCU|nr:putative gustatory receptor 98c [Lucilia cuprina]